MNHPTNLQELLAFNVRKLQITQQIDEYSSKISRLKTSRKSKYTNVKEVNVEIDKLTQTVVDMKEERNDLLTLPPIQTLYIGRVVDDAGTIHDTKAFKGLVSALAARNKIMTSLANSGALSRDSVFCVRTTTKTHIGTKIVNKKRNTSLRNRSGE